MINYRLIVNILGMLLMLIALFVPVGALFSVYYGDDDIFALVISSLITFFSGFLLWAATGFQRASRGTELRKREGYLIVSLSWIIISAFGAIPFVLYGAIPSYTDAFFETISGFTTTGASVLNDIEAMPHGLLFWRSMTHWLGGMGIIVLSLAILPLLGVGGAQLFDAEMAGPTKDKIHPQIQGTAKRLWGVYFVLTALETVLLMFGGMSFFDALCHAFGTMATGGFSTKQASVAYYNSAYIDYVILIFMFIAGTNFTLHYHAFHGRFRNFVKDDEFRFYFWMTLSLVIITAFTIFRHTPAGVEKSFRDSAFQVVSIISSTGYATADYERWSEYSTYMFLVMLFFGASAGSTTGGIKMIRLLLLSRNGLLELKRLIHPHALVPVRLNGKIVPENIIQNVLAFFVLYILIFVTGSLIMVATGMDILSAMGAVAASLGCIGPGIGTVGPMGNYHDVSVFGKWFLSFCMLLGRLEIFTIFVIFSPSYWKV